MALVIPLSHAAECCRNSVAVVASLSGSATLRSPGSAEKIAVASLDWLTEGATLEVGPRSQVVLILLNGRRYELSEGAKATVTANAAPKITGASRELPALPPMPKPAQVEADFAPTPGAVRTRGQDQMSELYPRAGTVVLPDKVSLHYKAVPKATSYRVTLEGNAGESLWKVTTESTDAAVPAGTLEPGALYHWSVSAMSSANVVIGFGMAEFSVLSAEDALRRSEFESALREKSSDSSTLALLAGVDFRAGLIAEACEEFKAALEQKPDDVALRRALESARASLAGDR
jgi:hypothetical protein